MRRKLHGLAKLLLEWAGRENVMRVLFPVLLMAATAPAAAQRPVLISSNCPGATSHMAHQGNGRHNSPESRKLGELPPAETFAAVYQLDERGCMVPVKYRQVRGRRR